MAEKTKAAVGEAERALAEKLNASRDEAKTLAQELNLALSRAEATEEAANRARNDAENVKSGLYGSIATQKQTIETLNSKVTRLESEVAGMAEDNARLTEAEAAAAALANKYEAEIAELRKQLKELQIKLYEFRLAVEKVL